MTRVAIVGCGLVGGSFALALRARNAVEHVLAVDTRSVVVAPAVRALSDAQIAADDRVAFSKALAEMELVLLAAPISAIRSELAFVLEHGRLVTDCGSTKRAIVTSADASPNRSRFVAGHPLAGGSDAGADHARADLFENRRWILCPEGSDDEALERVEGFIRSVGAIPERMSALEHDRAVAVTSQLPQLLASALAVAAEDVDARARGPGFESVTRIAGGNPGIWRDIFQTNADLISEAIRAFGAELASVAEALERNPPDADGARAVLEAARQLRRR